MLFLAEKDSCQWILSLICSDLEDKSGACHRSLQILNILKSDGWQLQILDPPNSLANRWHTFNYGVNSVFRHGPLQPFSLSSLRSQGHVAYWVSDLHHRFPLLHGVVLEGTGFGALLCLAEWRRRGVFTVVVPANIESLAPQSGSWTHQSPDVARRFSYERRWWEMADSIFAISLEEVWWLKLHGIDAEHLPYYPTPEREHQLMIIRQQRSPDARLGCLWLADFRNPANRIGAHLTLDWLNTCASPPDRLVVAGRGCDWVQEILPTGLFTNMSFLGEVSDTQLNQLYRNCTAQLIVHPATSGMLTRVIDAAIAGIPVLGNLMALKSYAMCFDSKRSVMPPMFPEHSVARFLAVMQP